MALTFIQIRCTSIQNAYVLQRNYDRRKEITTKQSEINLLETPPKLDIFLLFHRVWNRANLPTNGKIFSLNLLFSN